MQRLELYLFGSEELLISGVTLHRRLLARIAAHTTGYSVNFPTMPEHKLQVRAQLHDDDEWRGDVSRIMSRRITWRMRLGVRP